MIVQRYWRKIKITYSSSEQVLTYTWSSNTIPNKGFGLPVCIRTKCPMLLLPALWMSVSNLLFPGRVSLPPVLSRRVSLSSVPWRLSLSSVPSPRACSQEEIPHPSCSLAECPSLYTVPRTSVPPSYPLDECPSLLFTAWVAIVPPPVPWTSVPPSNSLVSLSPVPLTSFPPFCSLVECPSLLFPGWVPLPPVPWLSAPLHPIC